MDFKTPKELLDFVIIKCGGGSYDIWESPDYYLDTSHTLLSYTVYAIKLLKEEFNITISNLHLSVDTIVNCSLVDTELLSLAMSNSVINSEEVPELPLSIKQIFIGSGEGFIIGVKFTIQEFNKVVVTKYTGKGRQGEWSYYTKREALDDIKNLIL